MNRVILALLAASAASLMACANGDGSSPSGGAHTWGQESQDPNSLAADGNTQHHFQDPNTGDNGISDPHQVRADDEAVGSPEVVARLHACAKLPFATLGSVLSTRGVSIQKGQATAAGTLYQAGASALGIANYAGRVPEALIGSTSAMSKMFDIFVAAAPEIQKNLSNSTACPGTAITDANGKFTKDGISCIIGKPATDAHVTLANQLVSDAADPNTGAQLAIAALLEAAHTCE
jgi:hypothetical protein